MNKHTTLLLTGIVFIVIGVFLYKMYTPNPIINIPVQSPGTTQVKTTSTVENSVPTVAPISSGTSTVVTGAPNKPTSNTTSYVCKDAKKVTITFSFTTGSNLSITLSDQNGKRNINLIPKESKVDPTFQNKDGSIIFINKGNSVIVEENGVPTFTDCKLPQ